jgi:hypothetical protein
VKERPILFSGPMVPALLDGTKTQTRRVVKAKHLPFVENLLGAFLDGRWNQRPLPYGQPGDRLWVRETHRKVIGQTGAWIETDYRATYTHGDRLGDVVGKPAKWTPAIHMPRDASRILLEVTELRVQRLQEISEDDAIAEGVERAGERFKGYLPLVHDGKVHDLALAKSSYSQLWESINGPGSWAANPWVWVIEFKRVTP